MRGNVLEFVHVLARAIDLPAPILEVGSLQVPDQRYPADLRAEFAGKVFVGCDSRPGPGVDRVEDVHQLGFADASFGSILLLETLEHVADPLRAMREIHRVLAPGGYAIASSCMDFPVHEHPADYWRYPPGGFDLLFSEFTPRRVWLQGRPDFPHTVVAVGRKGGGSEALDELDQRIRSIRGSTAQEISPRLGFDPFRALGEPLADAEVALYPERMLHVALDRIHARDEEIARLSSENQELRRRLGES